MKGSEEYTEMYNKTMSKDNYYNMQTPMFLNRNR